MKQMMFTPLDAERGAESGAESGALPAGGLAGGTVHEMRAAAGGVSHLALAVRLLAAWAAEHSAPILWVSVTPDFYAPGIAWLGLDPGRILFAQARDDAGCLGSLEVALRGGMAGVAQASAVSRLAARRLALAARQGGSIGFLVRHAGRRTAEDSTAFATRWFVAPGQGGVRAELLYARGGRPGLFRVAMKEGFDEAAPALAMVSERASERASERVERRRAGG